MYLQSSAECKKKCKVCGHEESVDRMDSIFQCPVCRWVEDEMQEQYPDLREGRNLRSFRETKEAYEENRYQYGGLKDKVIKIIMKNGELKEGPCRDYRYGLLHMPKNGGWLNIEEMESIEIISDIVHFKCPVLAGLADEEIEEASCLFVRTAVDNPGRDTGTEKWIGAYNPNYAAVCGKCKRHFPRIKYAY